MKRLSIVAALLLMILPSAALAQNTLVFDTETIARARVLSAESLGSALIPGTEVYAESQILSVEVLSGPDRGMTPTFKNDFVQLATGDEFYVRHITNPLDGIDTWSVSDPYRLPVLIALAVGFLVLLLLFGGIQGIRGLVSLLGSLVLIFYLLLPDIYAGHSPILISIGVASLIIVVGSYVTHGFNRTTSSAMLGMVATVLVTGAATYWAIDAAQLTGFTSETNVYLNFNTDGRISMIGLLFGGIMIGLLGVLYDIAIGQAVAVEELFRAGDRYTRSQVFRRAMRIGREHIGALVNTLAIAYVGASLPLLLLFKQSSTGIAYIINSEIFATEIIRILMGSIGLVLAVPITTLLAAYMLRTTAKDGKLTHGHSHSHSSIPMP